MAACVDVGSFEVDGLRLITRADDAKRESIAWAQGTRMVDAGVVRAMTSGRMEGAWNAAATALLRAAKAEEQEQILEGYLGQMRLAERVIPGFVEETRENGEDAYFGPDRREI